jgi:hypothetical protein
MCTFLQAAAAEVSMPQLNGPQRHTLLLQHLQRCFSLLQPAFAELYAYCLADSAVHGHLQDSPAPATAQVNKHAAAVHG